MEQVEDRIILDLCGGTGAWSKPYKEAGYETRIITLPGYDLTDEKTVCMLCEMKNVYGIHYATDCTCWAKSG